MRVRIAAALLLPCLAAEASAGPIVRWTRRDGANAVAVNGRVFTLDRLLDLYEQHPERFEGLPIARGLALGKEELLDRRALNPRRFDHYHPCLGWLLKDAFPDVPTPPPLPIGAVGPIGQQPDIPGVPPDSPPPAPSSQPPPPVPEPPGYLLAVAGLVAVGARRVLAATRAARWPRRRPGGG